MFVVLLAKYHFAVIFNNSLHIFFVGVSLTLSVNLYHFAVIFENIINYNSIFFVGGPLASSVKRAANFHNRRNQFQTILRQMCLQQKGITMCHADGSSFKILLQPYPFLLVICYIYSAVSK